MSLGCLQSKKVALLPGSGAVAVVAARLVKRIWDSKVLQRDVQATSLGQHQLHLENPLHDLRVLRVNVERRSGIRAHHLLHSIAKIIGRQLDADSRPVGTHPLQLIVRVQRHRQPVDDVRTCLLCRHCMRRDISRRARVDLSKGHRARVYFRVGAIEHGRGRHLVVRGGPLRRDTGKTKDALSLYECGFFGSGLVIRIDPGLLVLRGRMTTKAGVDLGVEAALIEFVGRPTLRAERHFPT